MTKQERLNVEELIRICNKIRVTHITSKKLPILIDLMIIALDKIDNARTVVKRQKSKPALTVTELHCLWHQITKENISLSVDSFCKAIIEKLNSSGLKYRRRN